MSIEDPTPSEHWLGQLSESGKAYFAAQKPEHQRRTLDMVDDAGDKLSRMFVGPGNSHGRQDGWIMPKAEWQGHGSPRTAAAWDASLNTRREG